MPNSTPSHSPTSYVQTVAIAAVVAIGALSLVLLTAGTMTHHAGLLTWSMGCGMVSLDIVVLLAVKRMIDDAVRRCVASVAVVTDGAVNHTAVQVGGAIADALSAAEAQDDRDREHVGVPRIYSGRS